ncbi:hypothetical protein EQG64_02735 [Streptomyces sp. S6]|nr:hypothetical protein EQG64_02735 [Streptomyces sp. S6]
MTGARCSPVPPGAVRRTPTCPTRSPACRAPTACLPCPGRPHRRPRPPPAPTAYATGTADITVGGRAAAPTGRHGRAAGHAGRGRYAADRRGHRPRAEDAAALGLAGPLLTVTAENRKARVPLTASAADAATATLTLDYPRSPATTAAGTAPGWAWWRCPPVPSPPRNAPSAGRANP